MPMTSAWSRSDFMLMWTMWAVMMAAMMHAAATPMVSAYARTVRSPRSSVRGSIPGFVDGYIAVWSGFALLATGLQWVLHDAALVNAMGSSTSRWLAGPAVPTSSPRSSTRCSSDAVHLSASCWSTGVNRPPHHQRDSSASRWPTQRRCLPNLPPHMIPIRCCSTAWAADATFGVYDGKAPAGIRSRLLALGVRVRVKLSALASSTSPASPS